MLYRLTKTNEAFDSLEALPFDGVPLEKHLEDLLAKNLLDVLFEGELMPILQERSRQPEADLYAVNKDGDLVIFELKRGDAGADAVYQALRYCEEAAHWKFKQLQDMFTKYNKGQPASLQEEHRDNFELEHPLDKSAFNKQQRLVIVGSAGNEGLIRNVEFWKSKGLSLDFIPYRIYTMKNGGAEEHYFEFFSLPFDRHPNPRHSKGVLFDTCRTYNPESIWYMCENNRVAAFGDQSHVLSYLNKNDVVFLHHKWAGVVAAGRIVGGVKVDKANDANYRDMEWLTAKPQKAGGELKAMSPGKIKEALGHGFFWARTIKTPYLSKPESERLLGELIGHIGPKS
jgi:hypothetical protein